MHSWRHHNKCCPTLTPKPSPTFIVSAVYGSHVMGRNADRYDAHYAQMDWAVDRQRRAEKRRQEDTE